MRTLEELRQFYDTALVNELGPLEGVRKRIAKKLILLGVALAFALFLLFTVGRDFFLQLTARVGSLSVIMVFVGTLAIWGGVYYRLTRDYRAGFKGKIIERIVSFIDPSLAYSKDGCVPQNLFVESRIFQRNPSEYRGDDRVSGKVGGTAMDFSEVHAKYETRDAKGRKQVHNLFDGLFFIADFNKNFAGTTVVLPDTAERLFGGAIGSFLQSHSGRGQLVKLEDPEFEKLFVVYGDDQVGARYVLSTSLMQRIVDFRKKAGKGVSISFTGSKVFIAIPHKSNLFEPRVFRTVLDFGLITEYFGELELAIGIVEDLNLNTRIWGKQ